jgi:hypothetical protein
MTLGLDVDIADHKLDMLKNAAQKCEEIKRYCGKQCSTCAYNVERYMKNECASTLLKTNAHIEKQKQDAYEIAKTGTNLGLMIIVIVMFTLLAKACGG